MQNYKYNFLIQLIGDQVKEKKKKNEDYFYNSFGMTSISQFYNNTSDTPRYRPNQSTLATKKSQEQ